MESAHEPHDEDEEHAWEKVFESVCVLHRQSIAIPHSIQSLNHGISIALHHSPSHSITLHGNQSHSITLHRNPSYMAAAAGAPFEHAAWLEIQLQQLGSSRCSAGSVLERGVLGDVLMQTAKRTEH